MVIYYLLPVILIAAVFAYTRWAAKQAVASAASLSPEEAAAKFNDFYSGYFDVEGGETLVGAWMGVEFQGAQSGARQMAGAALNSAAGAVVGVSTYVPQVVVGLTSTGRVLVSREYSEMGQRGSFKQVAAFAPGTEVVNAAAALPGGDPGAAPKNAFNPGVPLEFAELRAPGGETYAAWLSPQGSRMGQPGFVSIFDGLTA